MEILENKYVLIALTFGVYAVSKHLQKRTNILLLNPILVSIAVIIIFLKFTGIDYSKYKEASTAIDIWLSPCVVAMGVPLYLQLDNIKKQIVPILVSQVVGCLVGLFSVVYIAKWLGATDEVVLSLAPKSVTTPIAMQVSEMMGGIPALTVSAVVIAGIFGGVFGLSIFGLSRAKTPIGESLSMGTASHAVGTSRVMEISTRYGAYAGLGLSLNGILTAIIAPTILSWIM